MFLNFMIEDEYDIFVLLLKKNVLPIYFHTNREGSIVGEAGCGSCVLDAKVDVEAFESTSKGT